MTDYATPTQPESATSSSPGTSSALSSSTLSTSGGTGLDTSRGRTSIADGVVAKIAALAAREVSGVADLGGSVAGALSGVVGRITGGGGDAPQTGGVGVEVGETQAAVDLTLKVQYPASIREVADAVRQNVIDRIEGMTGLQVVEVNIAVNDLVFPGQDRQDRQDRQEQQPASSSTGRVQ